MKQMPQSLVTRLPLKAKIKGVVKGLCRCYGDQFHQENYRNLLSNDWAFFDAITGTANDEEC